MPCLYFPSCQPLESVQCCSKFIHNLSTVKLEDMDKDDRKCMICLENFYKGKDDEQAVRLPCTHIIGKRCLIRNINPLQLLHPTCPYCRQDIHPQLPVCQPCVDSYRPTFESEMRNNWRFSPVWKTLKAWELRPDLFEVLNAPSLYAWRIEVEYILYAVARGKARFSEAERWRKLAFTRPKICKAILVVVLYNAC